MLMLNDEEVKSLINVKDCLEYMETAYRDLADGIAVEVPRERLFVDIETNGMVYSLGRQCGAVPRFGLSALRITSNRRGEARNPHDYHCILLFSLETGALLAYLQGFTLSGLRLGATTALAAKYLAPEEPIDLGIFGSGKQARANLAGIAAVRHVRRAKVYSPNPSHRTLFCKEMGRLLNIEIVPVDKPKDAVRGSTVVLGASNAWEPLYDGNWIEDGALVISLRNSDHNKTPREFDETTINRSSLIVVSYKKQIRWDDQRELLDPLEKEPASWEKVYELADLVTGKVPKRISSNDIVFYHSNTGMGIQFAAAGYKVLETARQRGVGRDLPNEWFFTDLTPWHEMGFRPTP